MICLDLYLTPALENLLSHKDAFHALQNSLHMCRSILTFFGGWLKFSQLRPNVVAVNLGPPAGPRHARLSNSFMAED